MSDHETQQTPQVWRITILHTARAAAPTMSCPPTVPAQGAVASRRRLPASLDTVDRPQRAAGLILDHIDGLMP
jgi:hypothetical protein